MLKAAVKRRDESEDAGIIGPLSNCLGLLRFVDRFATGDRMERDRVVINFLHAGAYLYFVRSEKQQAIK
jgi:hypothetical protein